MPKHLIQHKQQGFSMIEVLITILIMSFGLLALAGLQLFGMQNNRSAMYRSIATNHANDLIERMRSNALQAKRDPLSYQNIPATAPTDCRIVTCNSSQVAAYNMYEWSQGLKNSKSGLPSASAVITYDTSAVVTDDIGIYEIKISWKDDPKASTNSEPFVLRAKP